jgi:elongation factor 1 alpha-like protein
VRKTKVRPQADRSLLHCWTSTKTDHDVPRIEQMRTGTAAVRDILGADVPDVTDKEIQESLWHYYYDVGKTVDYILSVRARRGAPPATKKKKKKENGGYTFFLDDTEDPYSTSLTSHLDTRRGRLTISWLRRPMADGMIDTLPLADDEAAGITRTTASVPSGFFDDMPWLGTPIERQAMFIEPVYLRGGLLGGAPEAAPKMSKLQALAAARKKKAQEEKARNDTQAVDQPMADLSISETNNAGPMSTPEPEQAETPTKEKPRTYASLKRKNSGRESQRQAPPPVELVQTEPSTPEPALSPLPEAESAPPSAFASTMLHIAEPQKQPPPLVNLFTLPYLAQPLGQTTDAFAGPSPDDVVLAAQSKGSTHSTNHRN